MNRLVLLTLLVSPIVAHAQRPPAVPVITPEIQRRLDTIQTKRSTFQYRTDYTACYWQAVRENRPLAVWVGYKCISTAAITPNFIHVWQPNGWRGLRNSVAVLVPHENGRAYYYDALTVSNRDCCASALNNAVMETATKFAEGNRPLARATQWHRDPVARSWSAHGGQCVG